MIVITFLSFVLIILLSCIGNSTSKRLSFNLSFLDNIILGFAIFGIVNIWLNFFIPLQSVIYYFIISIIIIYAIKEISYIKKKNFFFTFLFSFFASLLSYKMQPGYDAGLYHFPFQSWISNEKIAFGLSNLNHRFSITSLYSYWSAPLWIGNSPVLLISLQASVYAVFFIYLFKLYNSKFTILRIISFSTIVTFPLWNRYQAPTYGLADTAYSIFLFITVISFINFYIEEKNEQINLVQKKLFNLLILTSLVVTLKPSGALIILYAFFFLINFFYNKFIIKIGVLIIPLIFLLGWYLKNLIISSCINSLLKFTCINTSWYNDEYINMLDDQLYEWKEKISMDIIELFKILDTTTLLIILIIVLFIVIAIKHNKLFNTIINKIIIIKTFSIIAYLILVAQFQELGGYYKNLEILEKIHSTKIIGNELKNILLFNLVSFVLICSFFYRKINIKNNLFSQPLEKFPFIYLIFCFVLWYLKVPDPRLAYGYFALLLPLMFFLLNSQFEKYSTNKNIFKFIFVLTGVLVLTNFNSFKINNFFFIDYGYVPKVKTLERKYYGTKPDLKKDNLCWMERDCYYYNKDITKNLFFLNYYILK